MSEFAPIDLSGQVPQQICALCAPHGVEHISGAVLCYCPHNAAGAWRVGENIWHVELGFSADNFRSAVLLALLEIEHAAAALRGHAGAIQ